MIEIQYEIKLLNPIRISTGIGSAGYLDNTIVRNNVGHPYIPGSSIKGKSRSMFQRLAGALGYPVHSSQQDSTGCLLWDQKCLVCSVFGSAQSPGNLFFNNALLQEEVRQALTFLDNDNLKHGLRLENSHKFGQILRTNVSIDRKQQTSRAKHLFTFEHIDRCATFEGMVSGQLEEGDSILITALLAASLGTISHLGGGRSRGAGAVTIQVKQIRIDGVEKQMETLMDYLSKIPGGEQ